MQRIDRYQLVAPMAVEDGVKVWSARDPLHHDAEVILHVVELRDENASIVARLRREALAISESGEVEVHISEDPKRGIFCVAYRTETVDPTAELAPRAAAYAGPAPSLSRVPPAAIRGPSFISLWLIAGGALVAMAVAIAAAVMLTSAEGAVEHKQSSSAQAPGSPDDTTIYIDLIPAESGGPASSNTVEPRAPPASSSGH